jgi:hypothetical protein
MESPQPPPLRSREAGPLAGPSLVVFAQPLHSQAELLEQAEINVSLSVAGVEVTGLAAWLQRQLVNPRTVIFTLYQKRHAVQITGALHGMDLKDDTMTVEVKADEGEESVALDRVIETIAYEMVRRRFAWPTTAPRCSIRGDFSV